LTRITADAVKALESASQLEDVNTANGLSYDEMKTAFNQALRERA
jgi:hypothetical protein